MILPPQDFKRRGESERQWKRLQPLLPPQKPHVGCQMVCCGFCERVHLARSAPTLRSMANGIGSILPMAQNWAVAGDIASSPINLPDAEGKLNWQIHHKGGSVIRAHQYAAGAKRGS